MAIPKSKGAHHLSFHRESIVGLSDLFASEIQKEV